MLWLSHLASFCGFLSPSSEDMMGGDVHGLQLLWESLSCLRNPQRQQSVIFFSDIDGQLSRTPFIIYLLTALLANLMAKGHLSSKHVDVTWDKRGCHCSHCDDEKIDGIFAQAYHEVPAWPFNLFVCVSKCRSERGLISLNYEDINLYTRWYAYTYICIHVRMSNEQYVYIHKYMTNIWNKKKVYIYIYVHNLRT